MAQCTSTFGEVYFSLCKTADTPRSLGCWLRYKHGAHADLASLHWDPKDYEQHESELFRLDYLCLSYVRKHKGLYTGIDLEAQALSSFKRAESECLRTNTRLDELYGSRDPAAHILNVAELKIKRILGTFDLSAFRDAVGWSSGASATLPKANAQLDHRLSEKKVWLSTRAWRLFNEVMADDVHYHRARGIAADGPLCLVKDEFAGCDFNVFTTVPKDAKTHRGICKEQTASMFLQKGVGNLIRSKLRKRGVNLNDQTINQRYAANALSQGLCTVDLSMASDTVSYNLVRWLLPDDWFLVLDALRANRTRGVADSDIVIQKFSSMGNGFTFELESLIFFAIVDAIRSVHELTGPVSVYGDDIIASDAAYPLIAEYFPVFGFSVNMEKSYSDGVFYESCGQHYFAGCNVTPIYQKEVIDNFPEAHRSANRLIRFCEAGHAQCALTARETILRLFPPRDVQPLNSEGDDAYIMSRDRALPYLRQTCRNRGYKVSALTAKTKKRFSFCDEALLAYSLRYVPHPGLYDHPVYLDGGEFRAIDLFSTGYFDSVTHRTRVALNHVTYRRRSRWYLTWVDPVADKP